MVQLQGAHEIEKCDIFTGAFVSSVTVSALHLRTLPQGP